MGLLDYISGAASAIAETVKSTVDYALSKRKQEQDLLKAIHEIKVKEDEIRILIRERMVKTKPVFDLYVELTSLGSERARLQERLDTMKKCNESSEDGK